MVKIGLSHGDVNGVSYELLCSVFYNSSLFEKASIVIYGSRIAWEYYSEKYTDCKTTIEYVDSIQCCTEQKLYLIDCVSDESVSIAEGVETRESGKWAVVALEQATGDLQKNFLDGLVTLPINKSNTYSKKFPFAGHTGYLKYRCKTDEVLMFMVSSEIRVGVVTEHIGVREVSHHLTSHLITSKLRVMNESLKRDFGIHRPKIGVLGLNPHAGDNGLLGQEEEEIIKPSLKKANEEGILVHGVFGADGFFGQQTYKHYDATLAMYHDQGLIPFKVIARGEGVNYTAGLPIVRTSPSHGTAMNIAGQGKASSSSLLSAILHVIEINQNRSRYLA